MTNQSGKEMRIEDVWKAIQTNSLSFPDRNSASPNSPGYLSLQGALDQLQQEPATSVLKGELEGYVTGNYRNALRRLEQLEIMSLPSVLLKVLCLLQMILKDELIGNTQPIEYLRDKVIPQLKHVEYNDELGNVKQYREWLERFCLGYELPDEFSEKFI